MTTVTLVQILLILFFHWVGDFLLQDTNMAINKSKSIMWLTKHVKAYMFGMLPITYLIVHYGGSVEDAFMWWIINGILHWCTDYCTSRWTSKLYAAQKFYGFPAFFSVIGLDQYIHYACLFTTFCIYTR